MISCRSAIIYSNKSPLPLDSRVKADKEFEEGQEECEIKEDLSSSKSKQCARYLFHILCFTTTFVLLFYALFCSLTGKPYINIEVSVLLAIMSFILSV